MRQFNSGSHSEPKGGAVVASSDGGYYHTWIWPDGKTECECTGFRVFGKGCKHISLMREAHRRSQKPEGVISFFLNDD